MTEGRLQDEIRLALGQERDVLMFRNNVGVAEVEGRFIRFGVGGEGGSDLIGAVCGRFAAAEIKTANGRQTPEQRAFQELVVRKGGEYAVLRSVDDALAWVASIRARCR